MNSAEALRNYFLYTVTPTLDEFYQTPYDVRKGRIAAIILHHTDDYIFLASQYHLNPYQRIKSFRDEKLSPAINCKYHSLIRDVCDASKHALLDRTFDYIASQDQVQATPGLFQEPNGFFAEASEVEVHSKDDGVIPLTLALRETYDALKRYLTNEGIL
ncbi:hypothetical protein [Mangrovibacter phragmitis]|uniref:hypothetical protein n=1 Tax=Mangrovibacter phragmitis TaxID=1691903 RepID=UPI003515D308